MSSNEPRNTGKVEKLLLLLFIWGIMAYGGYQLRGIEEGERSMDAEAGRYFEQVDSMKNLSSSSEAAQLPEDKGQER